MKCQKCGRDVGKQQNMCPYCGSNIENVKVKMSGIMILLISLIAGLSVIFIGMLVGFIIYFYGGQTDEFIGKGGGGGTSYTPAYSAYAQDDIVLTASCTEFNVDSYEAEVLFYAKCDSLGTHIDLADENGNVLARMLDDGDYEGSGDYIKDDGVYTVRRYLDISSETVYYFTAFASGFARGAEPLKITVIEPLTEQQLIDNSIVDLAIGTLITSGEYASMSVGRRAEAVLEELEYLADKELIEKDSILMNEERCLVTYYYASGVMGGIMYDDFTAEENAPLPASAAYAAVSSNRYMGKSFREDYGAKAIMLYATDGVDSIRYPVVSSLVGDWNERGLTTILDSTVTVDDMKRLSGLDFICVDAHGLFYEIKYKHEDSLKWFSHLNMETRSTVTAPSLFLREAPTPQSDKWYSNDLKTGRIVKLNGGYGLTSAFFDYYYDEDDLKGSIIYFCCCELMGAMGEVDEAWSDVLMSKNVGAFVAYHNSVFSFYVYDMLSSFVPDLILGMTAGDALDEAKEKFGDDDSEWCKIRKAEFDPHSFRAYPILRGSERAYLASGKSWIELD